jgi:hypothetical protein
MAVEIRHEVAMRFLAPASLSQDDLRLSMRVALEILMEMGIRDVSIRFLGKGKPHDRPQTPPTGKL